MECRSKPNNHWYFLNELVPLLSEWYDIRNHVSGGYSIENTDLGIVDYYPKANKVLIRKENTWLTNGRKWIINNLIKDL